MYGQIPKDYVPQPNLPLANCIFTPALLTGFFFIGFIYFRPDVDRAETFFLWMGVGCLSTAVLGFVIGYLLRNSAVLNLIIRWMLAILVLIMIGTGVYMSWQDFVAVFT